MYCVGLREKEIDRWIDREKLMFIFNGKINYNFRRMRKNMTLVCKFAYIRLQIIPEISDISRITVLKIMNVSK